MRPGIEGKCARRAHENVVRSEARVSGRGLIRVVGGVQGVGERVSLLLQKHGPPVAADARRSDPREHGPRGVQVESVRVGHGDPIVDAVERERPAIPARARPRNTADQRAGVRVARGVRRGRPRSLIERPGRDDTREGMVRGGERRRAVLTAAKQRDDPNNCNGSERRPR